MVVPEMIQEDQGTSSGCARYDMATVEDEQSWGTGMRESA